MKRNDDIKLYNILLPIWLLLFWPSLLWLFLIPANYLIDRVVLRWSLGSMPDKGLFCRKHTWKICLAGFASDFAGAVILFAVFLCTGMAGDDSPAKDFLDDLGYGVGFNPFANAVGFLIVALSIAVAGLLIYLLDKMILKKAGLDIEQAKKSAIRLALITAPYLYFVPSELLYGDGFII
jgi:hypothetical protein